MSNRKPVSLDPEIVAIAALGWIASDKERLDRFLSLTGVDAGDIRALAASSGFLAAVLDHLMSDDPLLQSFAADQGLDPASVSLARRRLGGAFDFSG